MGREEKATDAVSAAQTVPINSKICDAINSSQKDGAADAVRALRKRLRHKNPKVQLLALALADQIVTMWTTTTQQRNPAGDIWRAWSGDRSCNLRQGRQRVGKAVEWMEGGGEEDKA